MSPYLVLGVPDGSSLDVCKKAYRDLCKLYHPDSGSGGNEVKFSEVSKAWKRIQSISQTSLHIVGITHVSLFSFKETI